ncbi:Fc.00g088220.m01.CDS01 [Cosmosporella sp. VM-42]
MKMLTLNSSSQARPLKTIPLKARPLTSHCLAWSCDAELAVATDDVINIFLPEYPKAGRPDDVDEDDLQPQFTLGLRASGMIRPDPMINAQLCAQAGVKLTVPRGTEENWFAGVGSGLVTGSGASVCQIIRLEWSPNGLGCNLRPVLTALSTNGGIFVLGEHIDRSSTVISGMRTRSFKAWKTLWGLGALLPFPDDTVEEGYRNMTDRIKSFSWAREISGGRGLLAYTNDAEEVVIMSVHLFSHTMSSEAAFEEDSKWRIQEVARFDGRGLHTKEDAADIMDPDFVPHGSVFSLKWSPWLVGGGKMMATLAYLGKNCVGFRKITLFGEWEDGKLPDIEVAGADNTSICTFLSPDAFVEWDDTIYVEDGNSIARGIIATPFDVKPFRVVLSDPPRAPVEPHYTWECSTTYPKDDEKISTNPITSLIIHSPNPSLKPPVPQYSLVRLSATAKNDEWYQSNLPESASALPQWVTKILRQTTQLISRMAALEGLDSDSDDSDDELVEDDGSKLQVHPHRFRIWGMAASPGGSSTAALISRYSTQHPQRRGLSKLVFGWQQLTEGDESKIRKPLNHLTTEGKLWEWMYGGGAEVPGTGTIKVSPSATKSPLREQFQTVVSRQRCVFCDASLQNHGDEAVCENGHEFVSPMCCHWVSNLGARYFTNMRCV